MANNEGKPKHSCIRCGKQIKHIESHIKSCKKATEGVDYINCKICGKRFTALYVHCRSHGLSSEEYQTTYGKLMCEETEKRVSERNKNTQKKSNYRNKLKSEGRTQELNEFNQNVAKKVSETVLSSESLRKLRSQTLSALNKTERFRKKASDTAKITSAREDIKEDRGKRLKKWRVENPEKFNKIVDRLHQFSSKPEKELYEKINLLFPEFSFKRNQQINRRNVFKINKSGIKQVDILSISKKIIVEFDGILHFKNIKKWNQLEKVSSKDEELNSLKDEFCIIRVSHDQFSYSQFSYGFNENCMSKIKEIIQNATPGLHLIGEAYAKNQIN
jgi:predicted transcriptional regulator/very-short-patch-repair endonuclease